MSKRVTINEELNTVYYLYDTDGLLKKSRDGSSWITDNMRFQRKIELVGKVIEPILIQKVKSIKRDKEHSFQEHMTREVIRK